MKTYRATKKASKAKAFDPGPLHRGKPLGQIVSEWAEKNLKVPTGPLRGQQFRVPEWQRQFLIDALASGIREAGLSVAREKRQVRANCGLAFGLPLRAPQQP